MRVLGVIPARLAAVRFPRKPLVLLGDRPLVQWVYEAAAGCPTLDVVVVATPDQEIVDRVEAFGGRAELTRHDHATGTDRVAEVAERHSDAEVVVNVQGDQPFVTAAMITTLVAPFADDPELAMTTLGAPLDPATGPSDPNTVK